MFKVSWEPAVRHSRGVGSRQPEPNGNVGFVHCSGWHRGRSWRSPRACGPSRSRPEGNFPAATNRSMCPDGTCSTPADHAAPPRTAASPRSGIARCSRSKRWMCRTFAGIGRTRRPSALTAARADAALATHEPGRAPYAERFLLRWLSQHPIHDRGRLQPTVPRLSRRVMASRANVH